MQDALTDPRCLVTPESLLVDGANGVCRDARLGARDGIVLHAAGLVLGVVVVAAWLVSGRIAARVRVGVIVVVAIASALPGAHALLALRADRPAAVVATAAATQELHDRVRAFARRRGCARTTLDRCASCAPVVRLALAGLRCDAPASIELHEDALGGECRERGRTLVCGGAR
jgi:hypothetical protein